MHPLRSSLVAMAFAVASFSCSASVAAAPPAIPDDWFFEGSQRPAVLKALEGKPAPELSTEAWIGTATTLAANRGKVVVVDFWATWCGPCMAAIPENVKLMGKHTDGDLVFIGVHDANSGWDKAPQVSKEKQINYPLAKDKSGGVSSKAYNVQFWPTYVVIDRAGIVRAAGLIPSRVAEVAELLLKEGAPASAPTASASGFGPEYYLGGAKRPAALREIEGKPAPTLHAKAWLGAEMGADAMKGSVVVLQFTAPGSRAADRQLAELAKLKKEFASQGVAFAAVCSATADWKAMEALVTAAKLDLPVAQDTLAVAAAAPQGPTGSAPESGASTNTKADTSTGAGAGTGKSDAKPVQRGITAQEFGVKYFPATIIIDRSGKVRIAGVRIERAKQVIEQLLAEPTN